MVKWRIGTAAVIILVVPKGKEIVTSEILGLGYVASLLRNWD